jgi:hypothetical protein
MDEDTIRKFFSKVIDILQSNLYYKKNLIPWIKIIFEKHFKVLINLPSNTLERFNILKELINSRIQYEEKLNSINSKLNFVFNYYESKEQKSLNENANANEKGLIKEYQPLLEYYESDDDDTLKKKKGKTIYLFLCIFILIIIFIF